MKPLEFKIEERYTDDNVKYYQIVFFYEDGTTDNFCIGFYLPKGFELNRHYSIADIYGYKVVDDREGL